MKDFYRLILPNSAGDVVLNNKNCASIEWRRVTETAQNLPENQKKDELISALIQTQNNVSWISSFIMNFLYFRPDQHRGYFSRMYIACKK